MLTSRNCSYYDSSVFNEIKIIKMNVEEKPSVIVVSSSCTKPESLIKLITRNTSFPETQPHKTSQNWRLDTKYYTAEVKIHGITEHYERSEEFNNNVEALIIHMDSNKESGLQDLQKWEVIEKECDPEVKLLISNYCTADTKVTKLKATEWCLKRGYELIELYPSIEKKLDGEEEDEIMPEKVGVERIIEALQTHVWPNLEMKDDKSSLKCKVEGKGEPENSKSTKQGSSSTTLTNGSGSLLEDIMNDGSDDFTELFTQLHMMKESIQSMPFRERKQCAEQMVTAFWKAIGGDEEEIADL